MFKFRMKMTRIITVQNESLWNPSILLFLLFFRFHSSSSDFNVVLPEICHLPAHININLTWIEEMLHLGIKDDSNKVKITILQPEEICDGSEGLLKFISLAYTSDSKTTLIGSLESHFCPTAASASQLKQKQFISWTCPHISGVISLRPELTEVIRAMDHLINYFNWKKIAFAKSRGDTNPFCDELGIKLQEFYFHHSTENISVVILGNYEDLDQMEVYSSISTTVDNLFLCVSYTYGFSTLGASTIFGRKPHGNLLGQLPVVLIPEWPLPIELFTANVSTLGLITKTFSYSPLNSQSPSFFEFSTSLDSSSLKRKDQFHNDYKIENIGSSEGMIPGKSSINYPNSAHLRIRIIESLLAKMILRSVKIGLNTIRGSRRGTPSSVSEGSTIDPQQYFHRYQMGGQSKLSFYFSLSQYEKGRWNPLINLSNDEKPLEKRRTKEEYVLTNSFHKNNDLSSIEVLTWVQILIAFLVLFLVVSTVIGLSFYSRYRSRNSSLYGSIHRKISRRQRFQSPYKILLTSEDIVFGSFPVGLTNENGSRKHSGNSNGKNPFGNGGSSSASSQCNSKQRNGEEKPDLLKVPFQGTFRKNSNGSQIGKVESIKPFPSDNKGRYKGDLVHLRKFGNSSEFLQIKTKAMTILENLNGLRHENITAMIGCLTEPPQAIVWEFCSRGSLFEILQQNDIKLDWAFKLSLLTDLVRGMRYLHMSFIKVHGNLTSHNCVVDARWVLKITDYGMNSLYSTQGLSPVGRRPKDLLWTAPELLRDETLRRQGTQSGDVYSFAIIMQEVLVRGEPFCMVTLGASEIMEKLKYPPPLIRPSVSKGVAPPEAINIMRQCWAELPDMRPDFIVIHDLFKTLNHGRKANIVDTMFQMLEKYSNNLEELIRERTEQLDLEKKKTEQLLNRMLPSTVADKLKLGLPFDPEEFPEVTIYFSDIVGFTTISAYSTPFEVVDLLNDLYTCFDGTINDYNVYKVETIGDAYMVVGGAPVRSDDHADQIATMALDLLHQSGKFRIRHLPYTPLRLRIGLHTGSCCAGVVGLTMPRYCLFGDTVNTASRMESTGSAWRIHISEETKAKLDSIGGYFIQYRGMTAIKGKGQMPTFWLQGKDGFDKELPKPPSLNDLCHLDEKGIKYGRTGIWPDEVEVGNEFADPNANAVSENNLNNNNSDSKAISPDPSSSSTPQKPGIAPIPIQKIKPKYGIVNGGGGGDGLRCLSPAEQVAHQLLNGKIALRGLRRQFSLDHGTHAHPLDVKSEFRKAPSLEESSIEHVYSASCTGSFDRDRRGSYPEKLSPLLGISAPNSSSNSSNFPQCIITEPSLKTAEVPCSFSSASPSNEQNQPLIPNSTVLKSSLRLTPKLHKLTILEESPVINRKGVIPENNSSQS